MRPRRLTACTVAAGLVVLTGCGVADLEADAERYEAELHYDIERAEAVQRAEEGRAAHAARVEQARRDAAALAARRAAEAADRQSLERLLDERAAADPAGERALIQAFFEKGWARGCEQIARTPRQSGRTVTYVDCMALLEATDVATLEEAEEFGAYMAERAVAERYGP